MKFFVTGRSSNYEGVKLAFNEIEKRGHVVTIRWTDLPMIKPYEDHQQKAAEYSKDQIKGVCEADIYIIFAHEDGNGVFTEFGAALASHEITGKPKLYGIGDCKGSAMFYFHNDIQWRKNVKEILDEVM